MEISIGDWQEKERLGTCLVGAIYLVGSHHFLQRSLRFD